MEVYCSTSDENRIPGRHVIFLIFSYRDIVDYVCFVVFCLLVVDQKIIAFEAYLPVVGVMWREIMSQGDFFFIPSESYVAFLNKTVSYKYVKGSEMEDQMSDRHSRHRVC